MEEKYSIYKPKRQTSIGGEALIEGIMMRGPKSVAVAIRKSDGTIEVDKKYTTPLSKRYKILSLPIFRGAVGIFESMVIGMKALMQSAEAVEIEEEAPEVKKEKKLGFFNFLFGNLIDLIAVLFLSLIGLVLTGLVLKALGYYVKDNFALYL
jgi:uncharacterized protein YqhQ